MVSFLHTADWQIGMKANRVADVAGDVRQARLNTAKQLMRMASQLQVDFVLIVGDLFENNLVHNEAAHRVAEILSACSPIPVYVLPGNHDPLTADSIYSRSAFTDYLPSNVHIFRASEPVVPTPGVVLLPSPVMSKESYDDPTEQFRISSDAGADSILIGIAHGSLRIPGKFQENDFPIALDAAWRIGLDYLALGHWHSFYVHTDGRTAYSGTHEPTGFDDRCSTAAAHVTIEARGLAPNIERLETGTLSWQTLELSADDDPELVVSRVRHEVGKMQNPSGTLLRLILKGHAKSDDLQWLEDLEDWLKTHLLYAELDKSRFVTRAVGKRLRRLAADNPFLQSLVSDLADIACTLGQPVEDLSKDLTNTSGSDSSIIDDRLRDNLDQWEIEAEDVEEALRTLASLAEEALS